MVVFGIVLLIAGAIAEFVADNQVMVGNQSWDMDTIGIIAMGFGVLSLLVGLIIAAMYTNTSHIEIDVEKPPIVKKTRKTK